MDECDEGDTVHGYRDLAWTVASIGFACALAVVCMMPMAIKGDQILRHTSRAMGFHPLQWVCPCIGIILGTSFYAYFITLIIFTTSTGHHWHVDDDNIPWGRVYKWEFRGAPRVLVFFDIGMILWWFSFIAHCVEYVTAGLTAEWFFAAKKSEMVAHTRKAVHSLFRYHCGSVLLAAFLIPTGRFLRNIFGSIKFTIRHLCGSCLGLGTLICKPCLAGYEHWFKYMTSDGLAYMAIMGDGFLQSAKKGYFIVKRGDKKKKTQIMLNCANAVIWLFQLVVIMSGIIFCAWWLQYDDMTFKDLASFRVTSVTAMAIYEMFITWFFAQIFGAYVRGIMHTSVLSYLIDSEANDGALLRESPFAMYMNQSKPAGFDPDTEVAKSKGDSKVAPAAPVVSEGLVDKPVGGPGISGIVHPQTAGAPAAEPERVQEPPATAPQQVPPATSAHQRVETNLSVGEDAGMLGEGAQVHS